MCVSLKNGLMNLCEATKKQQSAASTPRRKNPHTHEIFFQNICMKRIQQNDILNLNITINWLVLMKISTALHHIACVLCMFCVMHQHW